MPGTEHRSAIGSAFDLSERITNDENIIPSQILDYAHAHVRSQHNGDRRQYLYKAFISVRAARELLGRAILTWNVIAGPRIVALRLESGIVSPSWLMGGGASAWDMFSQQIEVRKNQHQKIPHSWENGVAAIMRMMEGGVPAGLPCPRDRTWEIRDVLLAL